MVFSLLLAFVAATTPVYVDSCAFERTGSYEHSVTIRFHNTSDRTVTLVAFDIYNGSHHVTIRDRGTFAPNVQIEHRLPTPTWELYHAAAHVCVVSYVRFEDGSTWASAKSGNGKP